MVLGGFAVSGHRLKEVEDQVAEIRERWGIRKEFHWKEYRGGQRRPAYEELVKYSFRLVAERKAALHIIHADFKKFDHKHKQASGKDTSINKLYWQLCLHRLARLYGKQCAIHIRLDMGNDCADICAMRNQLCAAAYKKLQTMPNCIRSIEPMDSSKSGLIQMADVVMGGIASSLNGNRQDTPKGHLSSFILKASGRHSWATNTSSNDKFLTVWPYRL